MARIEFKIDRDSNGSAIITTTVERIDPTDEILLVTETANAALQWNRDSPFAAPAAEKVYTLPHASAPREPLRAEKTVDLSQQVAQCGEIAGEFVAWPQGPGLGGGGSTHMTGGGGGGNM